MMDQLKEAKEWRLLLGFLTPFKISLLIICMIYCERAVDKREEVKLIVEVIKHIDAFNQSESVNCIDECSVEAILSLLRNTKSMMAGTPLLELVLDRIIAIRSLDDLLHFASKIDNYLLPEGKIVNELKENVMRVRKSSILGGFFCKSKLALEYMNFDQATALSELYLEFRQQAIDVQMGRSAPAASGKAISLSNLENILDHQMREMERSGYCLSDETKEMLEDILARQQKLPATGYFLKYLDACQNREYELAFEFLHRFYDYMIDSKGRTHYQYALFALAIIHSEFGEGAESIKAARESIAVSRENTDTNCLIQIISWLKIFLKIHPRLKSEDSSSVNDFLNSFRRDHLELSENSAALESEILLLPERSGTITSLFESLLKAFVICFQPACSVTTTLYYVQSVAWERCGLMTLNDLYYRMSHSTNSSQSQEISKYTTSIRQSKRWQKKLSLELIIAQMKDMKPQIDQVALFQRSWLPFYQLLGLGKCIRDQGFQRSKQYLSTLSAFPITEFDTQQEIIYHAIQSNMSNGNYVEAARLIEQALSEKEEADALSIFHLRFKLLRCQLQCHLNRPSRVFTAIVKGYFMSEKKGYYSLALEYLTVFAHSLNVTGQFENSFRILDAALPRIIESGDKANLGNAYYQLSIARYGKIHQTKQSNFQRERGLSQEHAVAAMRCYDEIGAVADVERAMKLRQRFIHPSN
ncbi:hypothetical protein TRVA0_001S07734 [Trichomonascus vanleenenianus]|uniref:anaphase promoting complex subunit 5 n=1 Tax=Trichomonascus vanleenenianus TaxID=2268995 RepID=UPI003ECAC0E3